MAERLGEALLDLDTNDKAFRRGVDDAKRHADGLGRKFDDVAAQARRIGVALGAAAATGITAMAVLIKRSIDTADNLSKMAQRTGTSVEELSRLNYAAQLSDVSLDELGTSIGFLSRAMNEFSRGTENNATRALTQLGISVTTASGQLRSSDQVLMDVADRFASMEDGAQKTALAMDIFGRSGAALIPLLNAGATGIAELKAEADRLGITLSTETAQAAEEFNDNLTRVGAALQGIANRIMTAALPSLVSLAQWFAGLDPTVVAVGGSIVTATAAVTGFGLAASAAAPGVAALSTAVSGLAVGLARLAAIPGAMAFLAGGIYLGSTTPAGGQSEREFEKGVNDWLARQEGMRNAVETLRKSLATPAGGKGTDDPYAGFLFGDDGKIKLVGDAVKELTVDVGGATSVIEEQTGAVTELITATDTHVDQVDELGDAYNLVGDIGKSAIMGLVDAMRDGKIEGNELLGILGNVLSMAGQFFLNQAFGGMGGGGGLGSVLGSIFSGFRADGGLIPTGTFGIVGERGPEPVIGTSRGAMVLPNSSLSGVAGAAAGPLQIVIQGAGLSQAEMTTAIADAIDRFDRYRLPGRVAAINADPLARG